MVAKKKAAPAKAAETEKPAWAADAEQAPAAEANTDAVDPDEIPAFLKADHPSPAKEPAGEYDAYAPRNPATEQPAAEADSGEGQPAQEAPRKPRKATPAVPDVDMAGDNAARALLSYCERVERLTEEAATIRDDIKEVIGELKGQGFDTGTFRKLLRRRAMDPAKREEQDSLLDLYEEAVRKAEGR